MKRLARILPVVALITVLFAPESQADDGTAIHSDNLVPIANLAYGDQFGTGPNQGTDIEFAELKHRGKVRDFAIAGSYDNGLQIVDVSDPAAPALIGRYDCGVSQGDVQVFTRDGRTYATYTMDAGYTLQEESDCVREAKALGLFQPTTAHPLDVDPFGALDPSAAYGRPGIGTYIVDITRPDRPTTVSFVGVAKGSHNQTVHPSGDWLYNSNSQLYTTAGNAGIEVFDIRDFGAPRLAAVLPLPPVPGLGSESHDITFNEQGTRAYSAALSHTAIIDTTVVDRPEIISVVIDPAINVHHQSTKVTLTDETLGATRDLLFIEDEFAGAAGFDTCPSGGLHVYDVTGPLEAAPVKVGYWNIADLRYPTAEGNVGDPCTMHVFQIHPEEGLLVAAFYNGGVRVVDLSSVVGVALGAQGAGMREIAYARFPDSMTWAAKTPRIEPDGSFHLFGNDQNRGLDVYRFDPTAEPSDGSFAMVGPSEA
ncbi:MAG: LVIVD repeat-containing protein, partial [Acidimicrobiia bacterium]